MSETIIQTSLSFKEIHSKIIDLSKEDIVSCTPEKVAEIRYGKIKQAQEKLEEHEEDMDALKKKRRKRRNYGTRTGIVLEDGTDTNFEL